MGNYLIHSLKYLVKLALLLAALFVLMELTGTAGVDSWQEMFLSQRGLLLLAIVLLLSAFYPSFGFVNRRIEADVVADRDKIDRAFDMGGYEAAGSDGDAIVYRMSSPLRRAWTLWEDPVTVRRDGNAIVVSGLRKEVVKMEYRIKSML